MSNLSGGTGSLNRHKFVYFFKVFSPPFVLNTFILFSGITVVWLWQSAIFNCPGRATEETSTPNKTWWRWKYDERITGTNNQLNGTAVNPENNGNSNFNSRYKNNFLEPSCHPDTAKLTAWPSHCDEKYDQPVNPAPSGGLSRRPCHPAFHADSGENQLSSTLQLACGRHFHALPQHTVCIWHCSSSNV